MLKVNELHTGYGKKPVLFGPSLEISKGKIVAIIGPNGAGKSTILKAICGLIPVWDGKITFEDSCINDSTPAKNVKRGITFCPQGNRVFDELSVNENLQIGGIYLKKKELAGRIDDVLQLFPMLKDRLKQNAGTLSGGEQQMLALGRALIPRPKLLLLDEPSLGLSPNLISTAFERIQQVNRERGTAILIVEQKVRKVLKICHKVYGIKLGKVVFDGQPEQIRHDERLRQIFL
ncbi:MAG: ABC transporter ATP-binding protein [Planctomycetes bacterium]|nr:ABC transporter ATP-binding protein [Planctomycetota bacterium]